MDKMISTKKLYGIPARQLAQMNYKNALELKLHALKLRYEDKADELFRSEMLVPYDKLMELERDVKYLKKIIKHHEFFLEEIKSSNR